MLGHAVSAACGSRRCSLRGPLLLRGNSHLNLMLFIFIPPGREGRLDCRPPPEALRGHGPRGARKAEAGPVLVPCLVFFPQLPQESPQVDVFVNILPAKRMHNVHMF